MPEICCHSLYLFNFPDLFGVLCNATYRPYWLNGGLINLHLREKVCDIREPYSKLSCHSFFLIENIYLDIDNKLVTSLYILRTKVICKSIPTSCDGLHTTSLASPENLETLVFQDLGYLG